MKVGILGGSFDPVHLGHMIIGHETAELMNLDVMYFVPCRVPPHKPDRELAPAYHRVHMLTDAVRDNPRLAVSDVELNRAGPSYSVDTLKAFRSVLGSRSKLHFVVGMDSLVEMHMWHAPERIFELSQVVVAGRPGFASNGGFRDFRAGALTLDVTQVDISSSRVRRFIRDGRSVRYLVPRGIAGYIQREGLYR